MGRGEQDSVDRFLLEAMDRFPTLDAEVEAAVDRILKLQKHLDRLWEATADRFGLGSGGELKVLLKLRNAGGSLTPGDLSRRLVLSTGAMTNRLDRLEEDGLIRRDRDPGDRRSVIVRLTERGAAVIDEAIEAQGKEEQRVLSALSREEQRRLNALLRKVLLRIEREPS